MYANNGGLSKEIREFGEAVKLLLLNRKLFLRAKIVAAERSLLDGYPDTKTTL
ncbi:hypothetical protein KIN20_037220 [Parelaphostrongylus tenuis]|uniref:Uncharacterized protein n=1 Tax=Parelaphostrongylus tenuis TaxID=148309 RepID=A0AAD5RE28_PARTN|nr:hypothetical protein KIN20_037220 [Parelaphostrongylus tenuis]